MRDSCTYGNGNIIRYFPRLDDNPEQRTTNAVVMLNAEQSTYEHDLLLFDYTQIL